MCVFSTFNMSSVNRPSNTEHTRCIEKWLTILLTTKKELHIKFKLLDFIILQFSFCVMVIYFGIWTVKTIDSIVKITEKLTCQEIFKWCSVTEDQLAPLSYSHVCTERTI